MSNKPSFKSAQLAFAAHIRNPDQHPKPDDIEERRMAIYRDLFISSISGLLSGSFPVIRSLYQEADWIKLVRQFFTAEHNKTPHFPEIPREFVAFLKDTPQADPSKPFLYELAHYEWLELHLEKHSIEINVSDQAENEAMLEQIAVVSPLVRLNSYQFPVHQIKPDYQPQTASEQPHYLVVWRDHDYQVHFTEMNAFSAWLLEQLINNSTQTASELLTDMAQQSQHPDVDQFILFGSQTLAQWRQQAIIIQFKPEEK